MGVNVSFEALLRPIDVLKDHLPCCRVRLSVLFPFLWSGLGWGWSIGRCGNGAWHSLQMQHPTGTGTSPSSLRICTKMEGAKTSGHVF